MEKLKEYIDDQGHRWLEVLLTTTLLPALLSAASAIHSMIFLVGRMAMRRGFHSGVIAASSFFVAAFHIEFVIVSSKIFCYEGASQDTWCPDVYMSALVFSGLSIASGLVFCLLFCLLLWREGSDAGVSREEAKPQPGAPRQDNMSV
mmetsp:Transcript_20984/g.42292  ORF Transcript_20984/g.42292 Transcript_20984/m.42292 type:complete len:147 (+) Transcript_20984:103-543(+)